MQNIAPVRGIPALEMRSINCRVDEKLMRVSSTEDDALFV